MHLCFRLSPGLYIVRVDSKSAGVGGIRHKTGLALPMYIQAEPQNNHSGKSQVKNILDREFALPQHIPWFLVRKKLMIFYATGEPVSGYALIIWSEICSASRSFTLTVQSAQELGTRV